MIIGPNSSTSMSSSTIRRAETKEVRWCAPHQAISSKSESETIRQWIPTWSFIGASFTLTHSCAHPEGLQMSWLWQLWYFSWSKSKKSLLSIQMTNEHTKLFSIIVFVPHVHKYVCGQCLIKVAHTCLTLHWYLISKYCVISLHAHSRICSHWLRATSFVSIATSKRKIVNSEYQIERD